MLTKRYFSLHNSLDKTTDFNRHNTQIYQASNMHKYHPNNSLLPWFFLYFISRDKLLSSHSSLQFIASLCEKLYEH